MPPSRTRPLRTTLLVALTSMLGACGGDGGGPREPGADEPVTTAGPWAKGFVIPAEHQEAGDPAAGKQILLNGSYMSCGVPLTLWDSPTLGSLVQGSLGSEGDLGVPGREGRNATLPHTLNAFTTADGAKVVNRNCLSCHSGHFDGQLVLGMGNATADFTGGLAGNAPTAPLTPALIDQLGLTEPEKANLDKILRVSRAFGPETVMRTVGMNPAESFTGILLSHHHPQTLAWSDVPLKEVVVYDADHVPMSDPRLTSDPPPWWRAKKKNALFYNGMARGDHRGTMALASAVCVDNVEEADRVDGLFLDIQAFIGTLQAPVYPRAIDADLARAGKAVFSKTCAGCHGTYDAGAGADDKDTYPNLLIPLDVIGTDPAVANMGVVHAPEFVDWYNDSFYGQITRAVPDDPFPGYMPPPLDGVWATGPFLHNGSVPTIELVLNSKARPAVWRRVDLDDQSFDEEALGWPWVEIATSQADAPEADRKFIYDTSFWSQTNTGHTFGDALTDTERRSVVEYLKTL